MSTETYSYEIGGKKYTQRKLVLGQIRQLTQLLHDFHMPADPTPLVIIAALGDKISQACAIALVEEGGNLRDKDPVALADHIEFDMTPEVTIQIVTDFFDCNPIASWFSDLGSVIGKRFKIKAPKK